MASPPQLAEAKSPPPPPRLRLEVRRLSPIQAQSGTPTSFYPPLLLGQLLRQDPPLWQSKAQQSGLSVYKPNPLLMGLGCARYVMQVPRPRYTPLSARCFPLAQGLDAKHVPRKMLPGTRWIRWRLREVPGKAATSSLTLLTGLRGNEEPFWVGEGQWQDPILTPERLT